MNSLNRELKSGSEASKSLFRQHYLKMKISEEQIKEFGKLKNDEERIKFASELVTEDQFPEVEIVRNEKDQASARKLKEMGNKCFGKGDFRGSLEKYTTAIALTPQDEDTTDLALLIANRSAAFYHLQEYQLAIDDIGVVLDELAYPENLKFKVLERKAKCLLALERHEEAVAEFKNTMRALDKAKLDAEKKLKMQNDVRIMMGVLSRRQDNSKTEAKKNLKKGSRKEKNVLCSPRNNVYQAACDKIEIKESAAAGRYASAVSEIVPGDTLVIENAFCSVLLSEFYKTNCHHCFRRSLALYPCKNCSSVRFCSSKCRNLARYHAYECPILKTLNGTGVSVTVLMSLRILTQQNLDFFLNLKPKLTETRVDGGIYESSDYLRVYHLVRHSDRRMAKDLLERSMIALFLLQCLKKVDYFGNLKQGKSESRQFDLSEEEIFIGGLLLRHLQILQFNAHEISEFTDDNKIIGGEESVFMGGGLYSTLALFNHSCDPGVVRYFDGTRVIVRAIKPIGPGETVDENYGPIYSDMEIEERRETMRNQYWFECDCVPCRNRWPTFYQMDRKTIRLRCNANNNSTICKNVLICTGNHMDIMIKCDKCGAKHNVLKKLIKTKDLEVLFRKGMKLTDAGNYEAALEIFLEVLKVQNEHLAPPFPDIVFSQQAVSTCMAAFGNRNSKES